MNTKYKEKHVEDESFELHRTLDRKQRPEGKDMMVLKLILSSITRRDRVVEW